jgi:hypothetical protein
MLIEITNAFPLWHSKIIRQWAIMIIPFRL